MIDPPLFYFTDWGWDTAYCRIFGYQSGNGVVYAAAAGGVSPYIYDWTYLYDGSSSNTTTWGGRNPGEHLITVTDAFGCELTKIIEVDSVNPIASFNTVSSDMDELCRGTADISAEFINTSQYYANPNNPDADTLFRWDLFRDAEEDWMVSRDWYETFDTTYKAIGVSYDAEICLIAYNKNGCSDTACKVITVWEPPIFDAPNVFTPNGDGENDVFTFEFLTKGIKNVNCVIVNRWGVTMAEMEGPSSAWDGNDQQGDPCSDGVYYYIYTAEADNGERYSGQGTVTLLTAGY